MLTWSELTSDLVLIILPVFMSLSIRYLPMLTTLIPKDLRAPGLGFLPGQESLTLTGPDPPIGHDILREGVLRFGLLASSAVAPNLTDLVNEPPAGGVQVPGHHLGEAAVSQEKLRRWKLVETGSSMGGILVKKAFNWWHQQDHHQLVASHLAGASLRSY